ncbi:class E sortase [Streptomyces sp. R302]|uniref:class E sortase n=1 Tax=unclassified Streptomyces TaxID=2593676 RepID=UPI00145E6DE5|nr:MULTISPECIES: class E sortase [unclassified Streptomyces]NML52535.1 class E sortase [Streptomyces sp. R301]NML80536.1 class E sortase [Streptomyces sp. R302]
MGRTRRAAVAASVAATGVVVLLVGCASTATSGGATAPPPPVRATEAAEHRPEPVGASPSPAPSAVPSPRPRAAEIDIPSIGVADLRVVPYEGRTDDRAGTRIQDRGVAASPYGERGGVGPGDIGNYQVTAHRLSAGGPLRDLPEVEVGDLVHVTAGDATYTYRIVETRTTSFRSERSLAEQRAAVPGAPGERPTRAMITLSTCATPEDNAAGNFWRDDQGNPEHRIDKIGLLTTTRPASEPASGSEPESGSEPASESG